MTYYFLKLWFRIFCIFIANFFQQNGADHENADFHSLFHVALAIVLNHALKSKTFIQLHNFVLYESVV
jgi:hypothetical protein